MYVDKSFILEQLPPYRNEWVTVLPQQTVPDIMRSMFDAHRKFRSYYDRIGVYFEGSDLADTCDNLYRFCKQNIYYREESVDWQSTAVPTGLLVRGFGDCKHYASFIAGCLSAIERAEGTPINWFYCFASYKWLQPTPYHVFVICVDDQGQEIWIDPTPGAYGKTPVWVVEKKV
jgi:hypothetical protein